MTNGLTATSRQGLWRWFPVAASIVLFLPGLTNQFVWDDEILIQDNESLRDFRNLPKQFTVDFWDSSLNTIHSSGFYRPIVKVAYFLEYHLFRGRPIGFLTINLLLHVACVILTFRFVRRRLQGETGTEVIVAAFAALFFAIHPTRPESVSWISGSTDLWMTTFVLCGLEFWESRSRLRNTLLAATSFLLAFLCKETALVVPALLVSDAILFSKGRKERLSEFAKIAMVVLALGIGVLLHIHYVPIRYSPDPHVSIGEVAERVTGSFGLYLERTFWPWVATTQAGAFPVNGVDHFVIPSYHSWIGSVGLLGLAALLALAFVKREWRPLASLGMYFAIPLAPVVNIVPLKYRYLTADRFLYWPMIGLVAAVAWAMARFITTKPRRTIALAVTSCLAVVWSLISEAHISHFRSNLDLWNYEYQLNSQNQFVTETLARTLWAQDNSTVAMPLAEQAVALAKTQDELSRAATLYASVALEVVSDDDQGRLVAIREFFDQLADEGAEQVSLKDGRVSVSVVPAPETRRRIKEGKGFDTQRALAHLRSNDIEGAEALYRATLANQPSRVSAWLNLIQLLALREEWEQVDRLLSDARNRFRHSVDLWRLEERLQESRRKIAAAGTNEPQRSLARAEILLNLGFPGQAREIISALQAQFPNDARIASTRGRIETAIRQ